jgi:flavodoxin
MNENETLVVYYSSSGNTQRVAQAIAQSLEADLESIEEVRPTAVDLQGKGLGNFLNMGKAVFGALGDRTAKIKPLQSSTAEYDLVVVGTPVYAGSLAAPVRAFLQQQCEGMKAAAFFCTGDDPDNEKVFVQMEEVCGITPKAWHAFHAPEVRDGAFQPHVESFVSKLS